MGNRFVETLSRKAREGIEVYAIFELDKTNAEEVTLEEWENRPLRDKLIERALSPLRPLG